MISHKVNRYSKKLRRKGTGMASIGLAAGKPVRDELTGFIHHPTGFPLEYRRVRFGSKQENSDTDSGKIGVIFDSREYIKPGTTLEIVIPLRTEQERFRGKVVLVRHNGNQYEIGLWLYHSADASRIRMVEQICHIEAYMQEKKYQEGPYTINRERLAKEWITKYASSVPGI